MATQTAVHPTIKLKAPSTFNYDKTKDDKTKDGWELLEDVPIIGDETLEFVPVLQEGDGEWVQGEVLWTREKTVAVGQRHLERLQGQVAEIPKELDDTYLLALGTVWRNPYGHRFVAYLGPRGGERRTLLCCSLDNDFRRDSISVRLRK